MVVHSSSQDQRRQQHLERELRASYATLEATVRRPPARVFLSGGCRSRRRKAAGAAERLSLGGSRHQGAPDVWPWAAALKQPRVVKALCYGLQVTLHERSEVIARKTQGTGCFVLLTNVPIAGEMAHRAGDVLRAYKEQHGIEQNYGFLKGPLIVNSLFLKKPERIEALGLVLLLALLLWRLVERTLRVHVETTGNALTGWDKKATQTPTAFMMRTKFAGVMVIKVEGQRQLVPAVHSPTAIPRGAPGPCHILYRPQSG